MATLGIATFGDASIFDRLYLTTIFILLIFMRKDINIVGVILILISQRIFEEIGFSFIDAQVIYLKVIVYLLCLLGLYKIRKDFLAIPLGLMLVLAVAAETYWLLTGYQAPTIWWYTYLIFVSMTVRKTIWRRDYFTRLWFKKSQSLDIDYYIYQLNLVYVWVNIAMIIEFMLRHLLGLKDVLYVYSAFSYIAHIMTVITLFLILDQILKTLNAKLIKA